MQAYIIGDKAVPKGVPCSHCGRKFKAGDVALAELVEYKGWFGWHKGCIRHVLDTTPYDSYETIKKDLERGVFL